MTTPSATIIGILLAAGRGERFGSDKLLATLPAHSGVTPVGTPLAAAACRHLIAAMPHTIAVIRPGAPALARVLRDTGARLATCERAHEGMGASLACGVAAAPHADGWIIALADMPWIAPATIVQVRDAIDRGAELAAPFHRGQRGHPVGFARPFRNELLLLSGDRGARDVIAAHQRALVRIDVDDPGVLRDVDVPQDLGSP